MSAAWLPGLIGPISTYATRARLMGVLANVAVMGLAVFAGFLVVMSGTLFSGRPILTLAIPLLMVLGLILLIAPKILVFGVLLLRAVLNPLFEEATLPGIGGLGGLVSLAVILLAIRFVARDPKRVPRTAWMVWVPFLVSQFLGLAYAPDLIPEVRQFLGQLSTMAMFILAFYMVDDWTSFDRMLKVIIAASVLVAIYTLVSIARGDTHAVTAVNITEAGRYSGPFSHPNILSFFLVLTQVVLLYLWKRTRSRAGLGIRLAMGSYMLVLIALLFATKTRSAWMASGILFLLYGLMLERRYLVYMCLLGALAMLIPEVRDRVLDLSKGNEAVQYAQLNSFAWRKLLWTDAVSWMNPSHYLLGYGNGGFFFHSRSFFTLGKAVNADAHSVVVQQFFNVGIIGVMCFYWMHWHAGRLLVRLGHQDRLLGVLFVCLLLSYVVVAMSDNLLGYLVFNWYFWFAVGAACSVACHLAPPDVDQPRHQRSRPQNLAA